MAHAETGLPGGFELAHGGAAPELVAPVAVETRENPRARHALDRAHLAFPDRAVRRQRPLHGTGAAKQRQRHRTPDVLAAPIRVIGTRLTGSKRISIRRFASKRFRYR